MSALHAAGLLFIVLFSTGVYAVVGKGDDPAIDILFGFLFLGVLFFLPWAHITVEAMQAFGYNVYLTPNEETMKDSVGLVWVVSGVVVFLFSRYTGIVLKRIRKAVE